MSAWKRQVIRWSPLMAGGFCALCGILFLPDFHLWPLGFVAYAPLLASIDGRSVWIRFLAGWFAGIVMHLGIFFWVRHTMISLSGLPDSAATGVWIGFGLYEGLLLAVFAALSGPLRRFSGRGWVWTLPTLYVLLEYLFPHIFTWFLGNCLYRQTALIQISDLTGVYGLSFVLMCTNTLLVEAWGCRGNGWKIWRRPLQVGLALWVLVMGYGWFRLSMMADIPVEEEIRVAMVQPFVTAPEKKMKGKHREVMYQKAMLQMQHVDGKNVDLIIWPEGSFPHAFPVEVPGGEATEGTPLGRRYFRRLKKEIRRKGTPFVMGSIRRPDEDRRPRNSAIYLDEHGDVQGIYDKRRLVPFGEYIPFGDTFPALKEALKGISDMVHGTDAASFNVNGTPFLPSICYEAIHPEDTREASVVEPRSKVILNLTNDVWFGKYGAPEQHLMAQVHRAVELRLPFIRATNSGISALVNDRGEIEARTGVYEAGVLEGDVRVRTVWSLYREVGNLFLWCMVFSSVAWMVIRTWRSARPSPHMPDDGPAQS